MSPGNGSPGAHSSASFQHHTVYLIHFNTPLHHARHYLGFAEDLKRRLTLHALGRGSKLMKAVTKAGIEWRCVRTWRGGDRVLERRLKNWHHSALLCPTCSGRRAWSRANFTKQGDVDPGRQTPTSHTFLSTQLRKENQHV